MHLRHTDALALLDVSALGNDVDGHAVDEDRSRGTHVGQNDSLTPDEILKVNIPTGVPCSYTFDSDWNITDKHYIGDPETIAKKIEAVANQGKVKK